MYVKVLTDQQVWTAGQVIGLIHDIPSCKELIERIEREAEDALKHLQSLIVGSADSQNQVPGSGKVGSNVNNPEAELWGIGKSKL